MAKKRTKIIASILIILGILILTSIFFLPFSIIAPSDLGTMTIYDDFNNGLQMSKWTTYERQWNPFCYSDNVGTMYGGCNGQISGTTIAYDQCKYGTVVYNKSILRYILPYYTCSPNTVSGTIVSTSTLPSDMLSSIGGQDVFGVFPSSYYQSTPNNQINCPTWTNNNYCTSEWCRTYADSHCNTNYPVISSCSHDIRRTRSDGANVHTACYEGHYNYCRVESAGGYRALDGFWYGGSCGNSQIWKSLGYKDKSTSTNLGLVSVGNGQLSLQSGGAYNSNCNSHTQFESSVDSAQTFTTDDLKIKFSYSKFNHKDDCLNVDGGAFSLGGNALPITIGETIRSNNQGTYYENSGIVEIKRYDDFDMTKYKIYVNGQYVSDGQNSGDMKLHLTGAITLDYVLYEPYWSCNYVNPSESVFVRDVFASGSQVSLTKLTYTPKKFCAQDLGVLIVSPNGARQQKGTITDRIAQGQTLTVPQGEYWMFFYVTAYVNGMKERCDVGFAYDTNTQNCVQIAFQGGDLTDYQNKIANLTNQVNLLNQTLQQEINYINSLNATIGEKAQIIEELQLERDKQGVLIAQLDLTTQQQAQLISNLTTKSNEQAQIIAGMQQNIDDQAKLINDLTSTREQQVAIIQNLHLNIAQQAELINSLTSKVDEQAQIIDGLNLNIKDQASLITNLTSKVSEQADLVNHLAQNLAEKAYFISQLTAENDKQADLIRQMNESFTNQGVILNNLNLKIEDDASVIGHLTSNNNEQGQIIAGMRLNIEKQSDLILNLTTNNEQQAHIIDGMNATVQQQAVLINQLTSNLQEQSNIVSALQLKSDEQASLIKQMTSNINDQAEIISQLKQTNAQKEDTISQLNLSVTKEQELVDKYKTLLDKYQSNYVDITGYTVKASDVPVISTIVIAVVFIFIGTMWYVIDKARRGGRKRRR